MNKYDEIKSLVEASRRALNKGMLNEMVEIRKTYGFLNEQTIDIDKESDLTNDDEFETAPKDSDDIGKKSDKQRTYKEKTNPAYNLQQTRKMPLRKVWMNLERRLQKLLILVN